MPNQYFSQFPIIEINDTLLKDVSPRVVHARKVFTSNMLATYMVQPEETVQQLAQDFYGDPELDWLIHLANQTIDPLFDYPLTYLELKRYVESKYQNPYDAHHWIVDGVITYTEPIEEEEEEEELPLNTVIVSNFEYESMVNDKKRTIKVLRPEFASIAINEFENLINDE